MSLDISIFILITHIYLFNIYRSLLGEDMGELSTKELERLEVKLDASLKKVRSSKVR